MKWLKTYKIFESEKSIEDLKADIYECFIPVMDFTHVKISLKDPNTIEIGINLDKNVADIDTQKKSEYGYPYRAVINGDVIVEEIADAVSHCAGMGMSIERLRVMYRNTGDMLKGYESLPFKANFGPGLITKAFYKHEIDTFFDFIIEKGDRVRDVRILIKI